ncbi:M50 family metallopeptidase [Propionibacteriaceae bacterium Y1700]|uniref:M50 family metallopeptidase n=1 Tax=Microlunatus sp. Y1700 TaxID=3418487 RepID=UPI003DA6E1D6
MTTVQQWFEALGAVLAEIWRRATTEQPAPEPNVIAGIAIVALVICASPAWPVVRMLITITHEGAHALVSVLVGRRLSGIHLNNDTSGVTISKGRPRGPGMFATLVVGYPGPALYGIVAALLLAAGYAVGVLWLTVLVLGIMLLWMRNLYGLVVIVGVGALAAVASWYLPPVWQSWLAYGLCWILLLGAPRPVVELARHPERGSDADQLGRLTFLPAPGWVGLFLIMTLTAAAGGAWLLLPLGEWFGA